MADTDMPEDVAVLETTAQDAANDALTTLDTAPDLGAEAAKAREED